MTAPTDRWRDQLLQWTAPPREAALTPPADGWQAHAHRFRAINQALRGREEPLVGFLARWLTPGVTLLDVGAGGGRFALPLAERGWRVMAVEPSDAMRAVLLEAAQERRVSLTTLTTRWPPDAGATPEANVVLCANVFYDVPDLAPFVAALDRAASRAVAVYLSLTHPVGHLARLWREFRGWVVPTGPTYLDAAAVVFSLGIPVQITLLPVQPTLFFNSLDEAVEGYRNRLGLLPQAERDATLRARLAATLVASDGRLMMPPRERQAAVLWWEKDGRGVG